VTKGTGLEKDLSPLIEDLVRIRERVVLMFSFNWNNDVFSHVG
jgi:hypothetical protein